MSVEQRIADILRKHVEIFDGNTQRWVCTCAEWADTDLPSEHCEHVTQLVLAEFEHELGEGELGQITVGWKGKRSGPRWSRYVSDWECEL